MATPTYLHIALGDSAGDSLKEACRTLGLTGEVAVIGDDLSNGPLNDGRMRADYWRTVGDETNVPEDVFDDWRALLKRIGEITYPTPVIWSTDAVSDSVLLRMACWWLRDFPTAIAGVNVTQYSGRCGLGRHSAKELRDAFGDQFRIVQFPERQTLEDEFVALRDADSGLRVYRAGKIATVGPDHFDARLLSFVENEWQPAMRAVGLTMAAADEHDCIGDSFYAWRIRELVRAGKLEAKGETKQLASFQIRRRG